MTLDGWSLAAALASALLHASWNATVKAHATPREAMVAQMLAAAGLGAVGLAVMGLPPPAAWPWVAASTLLNVAAVSALLKAYEHGGFGTVYPVMRAIGVLGVAAVAPLVLGERPGPWVLMGVGLIAAALVLLTLDARRGGAVARPPAAGAAGAASAGVGAPAADSAGSASAPAVAGGSPPTPAVPAGFPPAALGWTLLAGLITSGYVLADAQGARAGGAAAGAAGAAGLGGALAYGLSVSVTNGLAMAWVSRRVGAPWVLLRRHAGLAVPLAIASMMSYLLILWVFTRAPVAPAAALRDTSALFAMLIAVVWLKERLGPRRLLALALAVAGVPLLRLG